MSKTTHPAHHASGLRSALPRLIVALTVLTLAACAAGPGRQAADADPMATLERRAVERWERLIARDYDQAYAYLTPGYRATRSIIDYRAAPTNPAIRWQSIRWHRAECARPDACEARLHLSYVTRTPRAGEIQGFQEVTENWLNIDGTWYFLPER